MAPTLKQLRYLAVLSDVRNFSRAAEICCVTQSTLSSGIQDLEAMLDVPLFERTRRKVIPTPIGLELAARAKRTLDEADGLLETARAHNDPFSSPLRLGVIPTIGPFLLPRLFPAVRRAHPRMKLILREEQTAVLLRRLAAGELDAVILAFPYDTPDTERWLFMEDGFRLACPPDHPLAANSPLKADDIPKDDLILLEDGHCLRDHVLTACNLDRATRRETIQGTSLYTLLQMVEEGMGITLVPDMAADSPMLKGLNLVFRPLETTTPARQIGLVWRRTSGTADQYRTLAETFRAAIADATPDPP